MFLKFIVLQLILLLELADDRLGLVSLGELELDLGREVLDVRIELRNFLVTLGKLVAQLLRQLS